MNYSIFGLKTKYNNTITRCIIEQSSNACQQYMASDFK